jgi:hypothetical protein
VAERSPFVTLSRYVVHARGAPALLLGALLVRQGGSDKGASRVRVSEYGARGRWRFGTESAFNTLGKAKEKGHVRNDASLDI